MSRPIYETDATLSDERAIKAVLERAWDVTLLKVPKTYHVDYMGAIDGNDQPVMWVEVKRRNIRSNQYETIMISLNKFLKGIELARFTGARFIFVVQFDDKLMFHTYSEHWRYDVRHGGRTVATRDNYDIEPVVHIPTYQFVEISPDVIQAAMPSEPIACPTNVTALVDREKPSLAMTW